MVIYLLVHLFVSHKDCPDRVIAIYIYKVIRISLAHGHLKLTMESSRFSRDQGNLEDKRNR